MPISKECAALFDNLLESYEESKDRDHEPLYVELTAISIGIKTNAFQSSAQTLIMRLSTSAVTLATDNPDFMRCLQKFINDYDQTVQRLNLLTKTNSLNSLQEAESQHISKNPSPFFQELKEVSQSFQQRRQASSNNLLKI